MGIQQNSNRRGKAQILPASSTVLVTNNGMKITDRGALDCRVSFIVGSVKAAATGTLEHSPGYQLWETASTVAIGTSTDVSISAVNSSTGEITATAHGIAEDGTPVAVSGAAVPTGLRDTGIYYADVVDANTLKLYEFSPGSAGGQLQKPEDAGTTAVVTPVASHDILVRQGANPSPLFGLARASITTGGDTCQLLDVVISQGE